MSEFCVVLKENAKEYTTTEDHFKQFRLSVMHYIDMFGLKEWHVTFCHRKIDGSSLATCAPNNQGKNVCFSLGKDWGYDEPTADMLDKTAFHEVFELMTDEYNEIICDVDLSLQLKREWRERVDHALIRRFENVVYPLLPKKE